MRADTGRRRRTERPRATTGARSDERGETLVELLVTITIISIAIVGLVASLGALIGFSSRDRADTDLEAVLTSYAESIESLAYEACTDDTVPYESSGPAALPDTPGLDLRYADAVPSGADVSSAYLVRIDAVEYWNGQTDPAGYQTSCPDAGDRGLQQITIRGWKASVSGGVEVIDGTAGQRLVFYKREA